MELEEMIDKINEMSDDELLGLIMFLFNESSEFQEHLMNELD